MTSTERDRPAALAASEAQQQRIKSENSMAKHTPGPWQSKMNIASAAIYCPLGGLIARLPVEHEGSRNGAAHNARLIAAAPELLEALELIANTGMDARQCMLTARAAIKKAIGDTP